MTLRSLDYCATTTQRTTADRSNGDRTTVGLTSLTSGRRSVTRSMKRLATTNRVTTGGPMSPVTTAERNTTWSVIRMTRVAATTRQITEMTRSNVRALRTKTMCSVIVCIASELTPCVRD